MRIEVPERDARYFKQRESFWWVAALRRDPPKDVTEHKFCVLAVAGRRGIRLTMLFANIVSRDICCRTWKRDE